MSEEINRQHADETTTKFYSIFETEQLRNERQFTRLCQLSSTAAGRLIKVWESTRMRMLLLQAFSSPLLQCRWLRRGNWFWRAPAPWELILTRLHLTRESARTLSNARILRHLQHPRHIVNITPLQVWHQNRKWESFGSRQKDQSAEDKCTVLSCRAVPVAQNYADVLSIGNVISSHLIENCSDMRKYWPDVKILWIHVRVALVRYHFSHIAWTSESKVLRMSRCRVQHITVKEK